jgi:hypothetical protein
VIDNQGVSAGAARSSIGPANALGELGINIRQEELYAIRTRARIHARGLSYNRVIRDLIGLSPGAHDKRIVEGHDSNDIDSLCFELRAILNVSRQVAHGAGRGESAFSIEHVLDMRTVVYRQHVLHSPGTEKSTTFLSAHSLEAL